MDTNLKFISIRKFANIEWEVYKDNKNDTYIGIYHKKSISVQSKTWDGLWEEIILKSRESIKSKEKRE